MEEENLNTVENTAGRFVERGMRTRKWCTLILSMYRKMRRSDAEGKSQKQQKTFEWQEEMQT